MDLLKSGQKLTLYFQKAENLVGITCTISEVFSDRITIELPPYFMRYVEFLEVGCRLTVKVFSKLGTIDFNTVVIDSPLEDNFSVEIDKNAMKLTPGEEIPVINAIEPLNISIEEVTIKANTFEISTQYLKFSCQNEFHLNDVFDCELILPNDCGIIRFRGSVVYVDPVYDNEYKITYLNMVESDRRALLYYMYLYSSNSD